MKQSEVSISDSDLTPLVEVVPIDESISFAPRQNDVVSSSSTTEQIDSAPHFSVRRFFSLGPFADPSVEMEYCNYLYRSGRAFVSGSGIIQGLYMISLVMYTSQTSWTWVKPCSAATSFLPFWCPW